MQEWRKRGVRRQASEHVWISLLSLTVGVNLTSRWKSLL